MPGPSFERVVADHYEALYKFAYSLTRSEADACDLTQQTFYIWATKGHQLRDPSRVKTWLFTTLHRAFLQSRRHETRFPHHEFAEADAGIPSVPPALTSLDSGQVLTALRQIEEHYQAVVTLFYIEQCSYREIAEMLDVPMGTVKSRLTRGLAQLKRMLSENGKNSLEKEH